MKKVALFSALVACLFLVASCGNNKEKNKGNEISKTETKSEKHTEPTRIERKGMTDSEIKESNGGLSINKKVQWSDDWHGLKTSISEISLGEPSEEEKKEFNWKGQAVMGVSFVIENSSTKDLMVNMSGNAVAVIDDQQVKPKPMVRTSIAGSPLSGEILSGVKKDGMLLFDIPKLTNKLEDLKQVRLKWTVSDPNAENDSDKVKEYDITLDLN